jgi:hypothetical protein
MTNGRHGQKGDRVVLNLNIGLRLSSRRHALGLTLRDLAQRTALTASFLNLVEHNQSGMSLDSLRRISEALDLSLVDFLLGQTPNAEAARPECFPSSHMVVDADPAAPVVRAGHPPRVIGQSSRIVCERLTPGRARNMVAWCNRLASGATQAARRFPAPTEELIYVLEGAVQLYIGDTVHILHRGDTIYFSGEALHKIACASNPHDAVWLSFITPPVYFVGGEVAY